MAFVEVAPSVHLGSILEGQTPFTMPIPAKHPGSLLALEIDEGFEIGKAQLPARQAFCTVQLRDRREDYETRRLQAGDLLVVQDSDDGAASIVRFRGRIRKPRVRDTEHGRIVIEIEAHGLWGRIQGAADVSVPAIDEASGKQAVDSVLDQVPWPTAFRSVPVPPTGADARYTQWAFDGPPVHAIRNALSGINPRSRFFVDAAGLATAVWLSGSIVQFRETDVRPNVTTSDSELHVINQVLATAIEIERTATTRHTSSAVIELDDDADSVVFEGTLDGGGNNAIWALLFRQPNGTYFPHHDEVNGSITATPIAGSTNYRVVATARARSGTYTPVSNFFQIQSTLLTESALTSAPLVRNLNGVAPDEPRQITIPPLPYPAGHAETLADNYLSLWGNPLEFISFEVVARDANVLQKVRDAHLWRRVSLYDGNDTHFGFVARRRWVYGRTYSEVHFTMMEDLTEGGDISVPFRLPFEWIFNNLAALTALFDRDSELSNQGAWAADTNAGSTPSNGTGPRPSNALNFVHTETSGGGQGDHEDNGTIVANDDAFDVLFNRDIIFRYCAQGDFAAGDGLEVQGRTVQTSTVEDLIGIEDELGTENVRRFNLSNPPDETAPYGIIGQLPESVGRVNAVGLTADNDLLGIDRINMTLRRFNLSDPADETGDYATALALPAGITLLNAGAVDASGDLWCIDSQNRRVWRFDVTDPMRATDGYGQQSGSLPSGVGTYAGMAFDDNGGLWGITSGTPGRLVRINPSDVGSTTPPYGVQGALPTGANAMTAFAIDSNGDGWGIESRNQLFKIDLTDPDNTSGGYGAQPDLPTLPASIGGAVIHDRQVSNFGAWTNIDTLPASAYPASDGVAEEGDTLTDVDGDDYEVVADGGWRDLTVSIPNTYQEIRLRPALNSGGNAIEQDIALRSIRSA